MPKNHSKPRTQFQMRDYYGGEVAVQRPGQWSKRRGAQAKPGKRDRKRRDLAARVIQKVFRRRMFKKGVKAVAKAKGLPDDMAMLISEY